jgi:hypothetical protein
MRIGCSFSERKYCGGAPHNYFKLIKGSGHIYMRRRGEKKVFE